MPPLRPIRLLPAVLLAAATSGAQEPTSRPAPPVRILEHTLAIEDPAERRRAADLLAARDVPVDAWLDAIRSWRPRSWPTEAVVEAELWSGAALEPTEIHLFVPTSPPPPRGYALLHSAHGTGGSGASQVGMWRAVAEQLDLVVIAPSESGPNDGYRFAPRERGIARAAIRWAKTRFPIDPDRVYLSGVSRGGHMTWDLALREPDLAAAIAPMIGGPRWNPDGQNNLRFLENVVHLPIRDLQGSKDDPRMLFNLRLAFADLAKLGAQDARLVEFEDLGHSFRLDTVDWSAFWAHRRDPRPETVVRVAATPGEGRAFWLEVTDWDEKKVHERFRPTMPRSVASRLDDAGQRRWIHERAVDLSARAEATWTKDGTVRVRGKHVTSVRVLFDDEMLGEATRIRVRLGSQRAHAKVERSAQVLLRDFMDRVDRSFLPVAEITVGG